MTWLIRDWAGNRITLPVNGKPKDTWESFDDAEYDLDCFLGDDYETDRQEYYIELKGIV